MGEKLDKNTDDNVDEGIEDLLDTLEIESKEEAVPEETEDKSDSESDSGGDGDSDDTGDSKDSEEDEKSEEGSKDEEVSEEESKSEKSEEDLDEGDGDVGEEDSELETLKKQNAALMEALNLGTPVKPVKTSDAGDSEETETEETSSVEVKNELKELLDSVDSSVLEDPEAFKGFLSKAIGITQRQTTEQVLLNIPSVIMTQVQLHKNVTDAVKEFYEENEDLRPVSKYLGRVVNEVVAEEPTLTMREAMDKAAERTRKALHLGSKVIKGDKPEKRVRKPAFVNKARGQHRKSDQQISDLQKDIVETLDL